jgi:hypothetical protein
MAKDTESGSGPQIFNTAVDCTAKYLIQMGIRQGDLTVCVVPNGDAPLAAAERRLARSLLYRWRAEVDAWDMTDPEPLPVRWTPSWQLASVGGYVPAGSGDDPLAGATVPP